MHDHAVYLPLAGCSFPADFSPQQFTDLHVRVVASSKYNFQGTRLAVPSSLHLEAWQSKLQDNTDYPVCDFLEFGWPIGFDYSTSLSLMRNHKGATEFQSAIESYLDSELSRGAIIGPFSSNPFSLPMVISPLNLVPNRTLRSGGLFWISAGELVLRSMMAFRKDGIYRSRTLLFIRP